MAQSNGAEDKFLELRRQAENLLLSKGKSGRTDQDDPLKLIHELQTYQIELELQNEEMLQSQRELMESKIRYTELYDFSPVGYVSLDAKGLILDANLTFSDMLVAERSLILNQPLSVYIVPEDQDIYYKYKKSLMGSKVTLKCELCLQIKDGTLLDARFEGKTIFNTSGEIEEFRIAIIDISDQKRAERDKEELRARLLHAQKMESIGTLAGGIAHDFNNILSPIIGFTELSMDELPHDHPVQENLTDILQGAKRARDLTAQILAFSNHRNKEPVAVPVRALIEEALKFLRSTIPANITIEQDFCESSECIMGNPIDIHEILMNLCTNAYQSMEKDGGVLKVSLTRVETDIQDLDITKGDYCCFSISDTGTGISSNIIDNIFDPYFTTKKIGKGSGLGLSVVHGIVKKYNGHLKVVSEPGKGSVFNIYLPVIPEPDNKGDKGIDQDTIGGNERILFVDDEKTIVKFGIRFLERMGYTVKGAFDGVEALEIFTSDSDQFDLIITDMSMPRMVGSELAKAIIRIRPDIPIIICTGFNDQIDPETAESIGIKAYIEKPVLGGALASKIRKVLDKSINN